MAKILTVTPLVIESYERQQLQARAQPVKKINGKRFSQSLGPDG
jgi:hypothetical protein